LLLAGAATTVSAEETMMDSGLVFPAPMTQAVAAKRQQYFETTQPQLTPALLAAYVQRKQQLQSFNGFDVAPTGAELTEAVLSSYIAKRRNDALDAIESVDSTTGPALTPSVLVAYAETKFVPTAKKVKLADSERMCLAQAIYHEARGESVDGQMAVANVIINRAFSKKYPTTICGVVFQNADRGKYKCQFTFACDGRSDIGTERAAWSRSVKMAEDAFAAFQQGERPGVVPNSVLFYHTTAVAPKWSNSFRRVAAIGSHIFYSQN
jgi:spore germination cell wall hydrolase CwlJ-like protein